MSRYEMKLVGNIRLALFLASLPHPYFLYSVFLPLFFSYLPSSHRSFISFLPTFYPFPGCSLDRSFLPSFLLFLHPFTQQILCFLPFLFPTFFPGFPLFFISFTPFFPCFVFAFLSFSFPLLLLLSLYPFWPFLPRILLSFPFHSLLSASVHFFLFIDFPSSSAPLPFLALVAVLKPFGFLLPYVQLFIFFCLLLDFLWGCDFLFPVCSSFHSVA